ncbi:putative mediator of RNA polymerase II transcription subunit 12 isoform X4 [Drosophila guanche]|uniref:putative mediator of RNA polymerase II transcription subunit 12 isoform X4 n=1 Tax=Drosophila guanche TaxID=7266 RepID=UPI0014712BB4|nr:putative mediator of RNA polymerase II transcription subunit 12 isoform X4 [Drosophila guanche]
MKMWTEANVNSAMGLQATAATKRKHELTFDSKDANTTYTGNCAPPPHKANKWAISNNNYLESLEEEQQQQQQQQQQGETTVVESNNNHIIIVDAESKLESSSSGRSSIALTNGSEVTSVKSQSEVPLPPTASAAIPEDNIAKLEVVAAVPCEPWSGAASVSVSSSSNPPSVIGGGAEDCISKLQAVAVPSDPWGSIATRSTLATTLLSADELDDDDDDFEDDYEEEESIIPTYCPMRYHPFVPLPHPLPHQLPAAHPHPLQQQQQAAVVQQQQHHQQAVVQQQQQQQQQRSSYAPGYGSRQPNYYSEPFPQQNCSRTGGPQHMTQPTPQQPQQQQPQQPRGFAPPQWTTGSAAPTSPSGQQFYDSASPSGAAPAYPQQQQQQQQQQPREVQQQQRAGAVYIPTIIIPFGSRNLDVPHRFPPAPQPPQQQQQHPQEQHPQQQQQSHQQRQQQPRVLWAATAVPQQLPAHPVIAPPMPPATVPALACHQEAVAVPPAVAALRPAATTTPAAAVGATQ